MESDFGDVVVDVALLVGGLFTIAVYNSHIKHVQCTQMHTLASSTSSLLSTALQIMSYNLILHPFNNCHYILEAHKL